MEIKSFPSVITPELAEETGWHIGDGSMNYYEKHDGKEKCVYQLRGHIEDDKEHYINRIKPIFKILYNVDISLREMPSTRVFGFQIWSNALFRFKESLGLRRGPKLELVIPDAFLLSNKIKAAVLRGIFDTDGCVYFVKKKLSMYPRMEICTISLKLAEQLRVLFNELGLRATMYKDSAPRGNRHQSYRVVIRGKEMFDRFMEVIGPKNSKHIKKYLLYRKGFKRFLISNNNNEPVVQPGRTLL